MYQWASVEMQTANIEMFWHWKVQIEDDSPVVLVVF